MVFDVRVQCSEIDDWSDLLSVVFRNCEEGAHKVALSFADAFDRPLLEHRLDFRGQQGFVVSGKCRPMSALYLGWGRMGGKFQTEAAYCPQDPAVACQLLPVIDKVAQTAGAMGGVRWWWSQRDAHGPQQGGGIEMVCWDASLRWAGSRTHRDEGAGLPRPRPDVEWNLEFPRLGEYTGLYGS